eukprot:TRINITY_DN13148_c0_g1::TRINITY_DN13148_c0_g1_i1::g.31125::m.31125 TRINITY_DN13148_c0_g1::TRINITY_DN13148_c0_g1_i1::g.31125  ORF type:complete len:185 (-),score=1.28,RINGv/PF12906.2/0.00096,RINGv/PF12906.2/3.4e+03,TCR_zetazeta/PF11628.3/0.13,TCR_zetazeta/PF11628.3/3.6e+02,DUF4131/PF13567.1/0.069,DPM2/PF07297.7/4.2e+02,DPM2/PF07297.7/0.24 TRINITY_DN13148_c0_g1_i1:24-545(-)
MVNAVCRFCKEKDDIRNMFCPCQCYKKSDGNLCHKECLEDYIGYQNQIFDGPRAPDLTCETCHKKFEVKIEWKLQWRKERLLSCLALQSYFEFFMVSLVALCMILFLYLIIVTTLYPDEEKPKRRNSEQLGPDDFPYLMGGGLLMFCSICFTMYTIWKRFQRQQSDPVIIETV